MEIIPVSVLIIAQNEAHRIKRCLNSLKRFEEIIIVDGGSTDNSKEICENYQNVKFITNPWPGFTEQRNVSIKHASKEWCFMIDADECCTPELAQEIFTAVKKNDPNIIMYRCVRSEFFEGIEITSGHGRSNYQERLFRRDMITYTGGAHHRHIVDGKILEEGDPHMTDFPFSLRILHDQEYGMDEWLQKLPRFTIFVAQEKLKRNKQSNAALVLINFVGTFFQMWFKSWRMGKMGINMALMSAFSRSLVKLYLFNQEHFKQGSTNKFEQKYLG
ncbi:MAG: glycosyltransferase family 2 protein [Halobacteriovoraceae bacterium]|nr:glycosyltransferase family 2 protein [Halobacteriovoraceae bacterium]